MLSRRQFLQAAGISLAAAHLPQFAAAPTAFETLYGRALRSLPVYAAPSSAAQQVTHLWSDTVTPILGVSGAWYRLAEGYAQRAGLQPMIAPALRNATTITPPFWAEVTGAVASVRAFCAADAPLIARVGHGGILRVIDVLPGDGIDWYGVADEVDGDLLGWTMAAVWSPARLDAAAPSLSLAVDRRSQQMTVHEGNKVLLTAPISTGRDLPLGAYPITDRQMTLPLPDQHGAPWALTFGEEFHLGGVYWHNRFGAPMPGAAVQVTPPLARWLYPRAAAVIIS